MSPWMIIAGLAALAGVPSLLWTLHDRRKHRAHARIADDVSDLAAEAAPISLHPEISLDECIGSGACVRACPEHEVLGIINGRATLINPLACVGHGACMAACPVGAIRLVFGTATRGVELPKVSPSFETSQPGIYIAGELGGMGLIRNAVEQGRQTADAIARSPRRGKRGELDVIVIGAGPAGFATTLGLIAHGLRVLLVDQGEFGGTIRHYPRGKIVMTGSFELPGYGKVRRRTMSKEELLTLWDDVRARIPMTVREQTRIETIAADGAGWRVFAEDWSELAASVVLALGRRGAPRQLGVPGEELDKVSYRLLEPEPFAGKHVLVVGGGNAAADCALALADAGGCASVGLSYRKRELARLRGSVRIRVEEAFRRGTIRPLLGTEVVSIAARHVVLTAGKTSAKEKLANDAVIVQIGGTSPVQLLHSVGIELVEKRGDA
jgi:thioredoxin reductase/NAD-dependent dihydropyrimidine dehydrogenase PreA subunit